MLILASALFLRLAGTWRAEPIDYHADEWVIAQPVYSMVNEGQVGLKTHYKWPGCGVIYTLALVLYPLKAVFGPYSYNSILIIQRVVSALAGTGALFIAFLLMRKMFSVQASLIAAALLAVAKLPVLQGHYGTITSIVSLIVLVVILLSFDLFDVAPGKKPKLRKGRCILLGLICGWGIASKWTVVFAAIPISGAFLLSIYFNRKLNNWPGFIKTNLKRIAIIGSVTIVTFLAANPDFLFAPAKVISGLQYEVIHHQTGHYGSTLAEEKTAAARVYRTIKLLAEPGSVYLLVPALAAFVYCLIRPNRWRLLLIYTLVLWLAMLYRNKLAAERHYLVPFSILLLLFAVALADLFNSNKKPLKLGACSALAVLIIIELLYTCAWISPFWKPDARVRCGRWILENVPRNCGVTWAPRTPNWAAPGMRIIPELFQTYPRQPRPGGDQYIIAARSRLKIFEKHPPSKPVVPEEWFPQQPPSMSELVLYAQMNAGGGPNIELLKKFHAKPSFLGIDLRVFAMDPDRDTTFANQSVTLFRLRKPADDKTQ